MATIGADFLFRKAVGKFNSQICLTYLFVKGLEKGERKLL